MNKTKIEWADAVWNPVTGCTSISPGCQNCYAKRMSKRLAGRCGYPADDPFRVTLHPERLEEPLRWKKPRRVFLNSMGDLFHDQVPEGYIDSILEIIAACPQHIFLVLTKRPQNINRKMYEPTNEVPFRELGGGDYLPNLWLGVSVENQKAANERIPILLQTTAAVRFVSVEPMLGPIDLRVSASCPDCDGAGWNGMQASTGKRYSCETCGGHEDGPGHGIDTALNWVICGGESGPGARPVNPDWVRRLRDQVNEAGIPFFLKQMHIGGKLVKMPELDGQTWDEFPEVENG